MSATTGMERLGALLQGRLPDRVPVFLNLLDQGADEVGASIRTYYDDPELVAEGQLRLRERYGHDNFWAAQYAARDAETLGSRHTVYAPDGPPNMGDPVIRDLADIATIHVPEDFDGVPQIEAQRRTIERIKAEDGGRNPVLSYVVGSFSLPALLMGIDRWLDLLLTGPEAARRELLTKCSDFCIGKILALRRAGVDLIAYSSPVASATFFSPGQFRALALEWLERDIAGAGPQGLVYFNGGGRMNPVLSDIVEHTGLGAYHVSPQDDIGEARAIVAGRGLVAAAINDIALAAWSDEEIDAEVARIMAAGAPGGGFIFGTLMMPYRIPREKIHRMVEAAKRHGRYAL